jgi:ribonuclease HIII
LEKYQVIIGSDEAGKGEWLGPITTAAVALTSEESSFLVTQGVMDSKELKTGTIMELSGVIEKNCLSYHVITITPSRFNEFLLEVRKEGKSLNDILAWSHAKAISQVYSVLKTKGFSGRIKVIIDEFDQLKTERRLKRVLELSRLVVEQKPRAEEETAVAAASILARAARERWIDAESKRLDLDLRKISATEALSYKNANQFAKVSFLQPK